MYATLPDVMEELTAPSKGRRRAAASLVQSGSITVPVSRPRGHAHGVPVTELGLVPARSIVPGVVPSWPQGRGRLPAWLAKHPPDSTSTTLKVLVWPVSPYHPFFRWGSTDHKLVTLDVSAEPAEMIYETVTAFTGEYDETHLWSVTNLTTGDIELAWWEHTLGPEDTGLQPNEVMGTTPDELPLTPGHLGEMLYNFGDGHRFGWFITPQT